MTQQFFETDTIRFLQLQKQTLHFSKSKNKIYFFRSKRPDNIDGLM